MFWKWPSPWWSCYGWWRRPLFSLLPKLAYSRTGQRQKLAKHHVCTWITLSWNLHCYKNLKPIDVKKKLGLNQPYRLWGDEKECQTCSFRSSSQKINQFRVNRYIVVSLLTLQEQSSQTGQILSGEFEIKQKPYAARKFAYWQLKLCIVLIFYFFVFFYCRSKMKYSWYQDSSYLKSRLALEIGYKV